MKLNINIINSLRKFLIFFGLRFFLEKNIKYYGWGLSSSCYPPWDGYSKNKTSQEFKMANDRLVEKIKNNKFFLSQFSHDSTKSSKEILEIVNELKYRHYVVYYSALLAYENTKSRNIAECGVCDGLTVFFAINKFIEDKNLKIFLYDSWSAMRADELLGVEEIRNVGSYNYLNVENTKTNLIDFKDNTYFNKGFIPEVFKNSINPEKISWLHIDLNSSFPTKKTLDFFYTRLERNGVILFDDYAWPGYERTRETIENFFLDKNIIFLQFMTGQAMITKLEN
tara:strand:+ start:272 stop:1117 length:846 start_codon:yes stop_codon:yes gene_type:complete